MLVLRTQCLLGVLPLFPLVQLYGQIIIYKGKKIMMKITFNPEHVL